MENVTIEVGKISFQLVEIPKGKIQLNDDRIKKKWPVDIQAFLLSKFLVTQDLYFEIMEISPSFFKGDKKPVESITWKDAAIFCNRLSQMKGLSPCYEFSKEGGEVEFHKQLDGFRMPTEAEWQYACQANTVKIRYGELNEIAWFKKNSKNETHEVGLKKPNEWGIYDMLGNVWEWCSDIYDEKVYGSYRIFRGGGWCDEERSVMATNRRRSHPNVFQIDDLGFRIAKSMN